MSVLFRSASSRWSYSRGHGHRQRSASWTKRTERRSANVYNNSMVDVDSMTSSVSDESAASGSHIPVDVLSSTESDESSEEDPDFDKRTVLVGGKHPQDQIKFIVFEEAILDVFGQCVQCGSKCVISAENQIGSCFKICIACSTNSKHYFEWTTGPCVSKMAAFHLFLASTIIAAGMESSKVLRLFQALKIPNLKQRELSDILK